MKFKNTHTETHIKGRVKNKTLLFHKHTISNRNTLIAIVDYFNILINKEYIYTNKVTGV